MIELLKAIFLSANSFGDFLRYRLNRSYVQFERRDDTLQNVIRNVVEDANAVLWWPHLLREARNVVPGDVGLAEFAAPFGLAPDVVTQTASGLARVQSRQLELKIRESQSTFDIAIWRQKLGEIEGRVCRIEYPEKVARGTGFLIGPNAVMTSYHVIEGIAKPEDIRLRFDYKVLDDGVAIGRGLIYNVTRNGVFDSSTYSPEDGKSPSRDPNPDQLDYAILRVDGTPGDSPAGGNTSDPAAIPRRWIQPLLSVYDFQTQKALYIVEHPDGKPMQVAIDSDAIVGVNGNCTRVRYRTETQPGSSGSPCFGANWDWVAIHHSGDPKYLKGFKPEFNQGIPVTAIHGLLRKRSKEYVFGGVI